MAKSAALHQKDNWRTFPRAMLASRAKSELARDVYPDVLAGCFTMGRDRRREPSTVAQASSAATQSDVIDAEFTDAQRLHRRSTPATNQEFAELDVAGPSMSECK